MAIPTTGRAEWLRSPGLWQVATDASRATTWGDDAPKSERMTGLADLAGAAAEATRQLTLLRQITAKDVHVMKGRFAPFIGKTITITIPKLGYDAGVNVIVLGANDDLASGTSQVTVLRALG